MTMLPNIEEAMEDARNGKLSPYWQNNLKRECLHGELSAEERLALSELNCILSETPQWSSEEELCHDMENIGGRVRCVQLRKHSKAREKRYSFGYAVSFIFACYQILWTFPKSRYLCSRYLPLVCG